MRVMSLLILLTLCGTLSASLADDLALELKLGKNEKKAAETWYKKFPVWVGELIKKNSFPQTHLQYAMKGKKLAPSKKGQMNKFEVRDSNKNQFAAYFMSRDGTDATGQAKYKTTNILIWLSWSKWSVESMLETYSVESNNSDADVVAFAMWIYSKKKYNEMANRVLTVVALRNKELRMKIEAVICEKEKWDGQAGSLIEWALWDTKYYKERIILIPTADEAKRFKQRESASEKEFRRILSERGDYKGRAPRRRSPTKMLIFIEWDIKNYKKAYGSSEFYKSSKTQDKLGAVADSIKDDLILLKDNMKNIKDKYRGKDKATDLKKKVIEMEGLLRIDPEDMSLLSKIANLWFKYASPIPTGNGCDRVEGMKKAIPLYKRLLSKYPYNTSYLMALGQCYQAQENSQGARPYYEKVIEIDGPGKGNTSVAESFIRSMELKDQGRANKKK